MPLRFTKDMTSIPRSISHDGNEIKVYAFIRGYSCSLCAPKNVGVEQLIDWMKANAENAEGEWSVAHSKDHGGATMSPGQCNHYAHRQHWFFISPTPQQTG